MPATLGHVQKNLLNICLHVFTVAELEDGTNNMPAAVEEIPEEIPEQCVDHRINP